MSAIPQRGQNPPSPAPLILFHPDCNRRLRNCTGSADPLGTRPKGARGLGPRPLPPV